MIGTYFSLMADIVLRHIRSWGLRPWVFFIIVGPAFVVFSALLFDRTDYAPSLYAGLALYVVFHLNGASRLVFLRNHFGLQKSRIVRLIENALCVLPFLVFLLYMRDYYIAAGLMTLICALVFFPSQRIIPWVVPTPFGRRPYEFLTGFRKTFPLLLLLAVLMYQAVAAGNFNFAAGITGFVFLIMISYYSEVEEAYFVWIHAYTPGRFLQYKIKYALLHGVILASPFVLTCLLIDPGQWYVIALVVIYGLVYLVAVVLARYAAFPHQIDLIQGILLGIAFVLPPVLLYVIFLFYRRSIRSLNQILL